MTLPNIWGQGLLFAFSAMDGDSFLQDDLAGILSGDRIGVRFFTSVQRELALVLPQGMVPEFEAVTGDVIALKAGRGNGTIVFAEKHLLIGCVPDGADAVVMVQGRYRAEDRGEVEIHDTGDGQFTALARRDGKFAFAFAHSADEAAALARRGLECDAEAVKAKRLAIYMDHALPEEDRFRKLYAKCLSVLKTQLYSPEGQIRHMWSTPDRLPHRYMWLWDSVFHSVGWRNLDPKIAEELILAVFDAQREDGFIPHMAGPDLTSGITQPPVLAWGAWNVYKKSGNKDFLREVLDKNWRFMDWCIKNRRCTEEMLFTWNTEDDVNCRCGESGMDNSPRFDAPARLQAIDLSCFMANEARIMQKIAAELGKSDAAQAFEKMHADIKAAINLRLWCGEEEFYYDYDLITGSFNRVRTVASFLALFAGVCDANQAQKMAEYLSDPADFGTPLPVPSVSAKDKTYGTDMWRGSVWINYNYMIIQGLREYGFEDQADALAEKTLLALDEWYHRKGAIYEFYDAESRRAPCELNRKGPIAEPYNFQSRYQSVRDYGWSCALAVDLLTGK